MLSLIKSLKLETGNFAIVKLMIFGAGVNQKSEAQNVLLFHNNF